MTIFGPLTSDRFLAKKIFVLLTTILSMIFDPHKHIEWEEATIIIFCNLSNVRVAEVVQGQIYLDSSTYDEIERDVKNSFEDQLGVLGGTMGLFTGFSILSGVEIIFFLVKLFFALLRSRKAN